MTRALLLSTYVKFVNLFPEIKHNVEEIFLADSNLRSADAELQQRASEYLALAKITSLDVLATVLEEMPPFPEKVMRIIFELNSVALLILRKSKTRLLVGVFSRRNKTVKQKNTLILLLYYSRN